MISLRPIMGKWGRKDTSKPVAHMIISSSMTSPVLSSIPFSTILVMGSKTTRAFSSWRASRYPTPGVGRLTVPSQPLVESATRRGVHTDSRPQSLGSCELQVLRFHGGGIASGQKDRLWPLLARVNPRTPGPNVSDRERIAGNPVYHLELRVQIGFNSFSIGF